MLVEYHGISTHNLKNIDFSIGEGHIIVLKGVSGCGKSSLAIDTIYQISEDELSQISSCCEKEAVYVVNDYKNILPAICLRQENFNTNPRSTIGTYSGINRFFQNIFANQNSISRELLRFNNPDAACKECHGTGSVLKPSLEEIVDIHAPLSAKSFKIWNGVNSDFYRKLLETFCSDKGIKLLGTFEDLPYKHKQLLLYGKSEKKYTTRYYSAGVKHSKTDRYTGAIDFANQMLKEKRLTAAQKCFFIEDKCPICNGGRFSNESNRYLLWGKSISEIYLMNFDRLYFFLEDNLRKTNDRYLHLQCKPILAYLRAALNINLGHLFFNRSIPSLSGGELQRIGIVKACVTQFNHFLFVMDEPTASLHPSEWHNIVSIVEEIRRKGNTILLIEHSQVFDKIADQIVYLGPGAGSEGGEIIPTPSSREREGILKNPHSFIKSQEWIEIFNASYNNVNIKYTKIPLGSLIGICGVSGSGKSSFAKRILPQYIKNATYICQEPIRGNSYSIVSTVLGVTQELEQFFAGQVHKRKDFFDFYNSGPGQCDLCKGVGRVVEKSIHWVSENKCPECKGQRFSQKTLSFYWNQMNIFDFMNLTINQIMSYFDKKTETYKKLELASKMGLGYLRLAQSTDTLSGGEAQRIKISANISKYKRQRTYILDEPFRGVDTENIDRILDLLHDLVKTGNTVFVIEHNPHVIRRCSYVLEFGPSSGSKGGQIVFSGTLKDFAANKQSPMFPFLM